MSPTSARTRRRSIISPATIAKRLAASPQLEGFRARGVEVLLLADPVDAFWVSTAAGFDGKPFKSVSQGAADIKSIALVEGANGPGRGDRRGRDAVRLFQADAGWRGRRGARLRRLTDSVACLIAPEFGPDRQLEKMLAAHGRLTERAKPILEINPTHPLTLALAQRFKEGKDKPLIEDASWLMLDEARLHGRRERRGSAGLRGAAAPGAGEGAGLRASFPVGRGRDRSGSAGRRR